MSENTVFKTAEIAEKIEEYKVRLLNILNENGYEEDAKELSEKLSAISKSDRLKIVFIGQYTAGKSTIISALTGDNSIKIDSDIATLEAKDYVWGEVILTDTPGLYTENTVHDARAIEMIRQSDLLVYCITSDLFNQYTLEDFKKWAFETGYAGKLFLVVNKMSKEAGVYEELVESYTQTINKSLYPHSISEFCCSFVDAQDYRKGKKNKNDGLVSCSHFNDFISSLNSFIDQKGVLGKLDTPIMIMKSQIDSIIERISDDDSNQVYNALLSRIEKRINELRNSLSRDAGLLIREGCKKINDLGLEVSRRIGLEDVPISEEEVNQFITVTCMKISNELTKLSEEGINKLTEQVKQILESPTAQVFLNTVNETYNEHKSLFEKKETKLSREQVNSIGEVVQKLAGETVTLVSNGTGNAHFLFKATEVSQSQMHQVVLNVGHFFGHSFKPWEAVNIAKSVGNAAKFLGSAAQIFGLIFDAKETSDELSEQKAIERAQIECRQSFTDMSDSIEKQYVEELNKIFSVYDDVSKKIEEDRERIQKILNTDSLLVKSLLELRKDLGDVQRIIF